MSFTFGRQFQSTFSATLCTNVSSIHWWNRQLRYRVYHLQLVELQCIPQDHSELLSVNTCTMKVFLVGGGLNIILLFYTKTSETSGILVMRKDDYYCAHTEKVFPTRSGWYEPRRDHNCKMHRVLNGSYVLNVYLMQIWLFTMQFKQEFYWRLLGKLQYLRFYFIMQVALKPAKDGRWRISLKVQSSLEVIVKESMFKVCSQDDVLNKWTLIELQ